MEIVQELSSQYILYIPVALVIIGAILLFTFGFKSAEQPPFDKLTNEERKSSAGKKRKIKDKKVIANGHVSTADSKTDKSPAKESKKSPAKVPTEVKQEKREKKVEKQQDKIKPDSAKPSIELVKNKKNLRRPTEKPLDFDDGDWETVPTKFDKKKKGDQSPDKNKKPKRADNVEKLENLKLAKEVVNRELQEKDKQVQNIEEQPEQPTPEEPEPAPAIIDIRIEHEIEPEEPVVVVEEKKEKEKKKKEKKPKKEAVEKAVAVEEAEAPVVEEKLDDQPEGTAPKAVAPAFDELGDIWTEAKPSKKTGKKKARRDN
ncbi:unnamed protein product [Phaedon cochleariae]|uniref:Uncharacterized protein n=1 Tax=Phaedon cochleariae TaxID=80249 RepID=A0A9N9SDD2_PHACE|nr:unnamed protein product [Phaedon cochleariae]